MNERTLDEDDVDDDPIVVFTHWYAEAADAGEPEPNASALATVSAAGVPSVRYVLLKNWDRRGFVFYTNEHSAKAQDLAANPQAALALRWATFDRQVRVQGPVEAVDAEEADAYWTTRGRAAQVGAWASEQSAVLEDRSALEARVGEVDARFAGVDVPRPPFWNGWRVTPMDVEFFQGRRDRLHDRLRFRCEPDGWVRERLSP
ncbi:MAG: pyridoxamine 5'-phosphate oxidase [Acidimicrobiales bacterium]